MRARILTPLVMIGLWACSPTRAYLEADRAVYEIVAPAFRTYLEADPALTPNQKARRARLLDAWDLRLRKVEETYR